MQVALLRGPVACPFVRALPGITQEREGSVLALAYFAMDAKGGVATCEAGAVKLLVVLTISGTKKAKDLGCSGTHHGAGGVNGTMKQVGSSRWCCLISQGHKKMKENAAAALSNLASSARGLRAICKAGGVESLVALIVSGTAKVEKCAVLAIAIPAKGAGGRAEIHWAGGTELLEAHD